jgi:glutamate synthase (NADPH/NADH) large chain
MFEPDQYSVPPLHPDDEREHDACALICAVRKGGQATHGNVKRTIEALTRMGHRTGIVNGEGDGVGIMTDIPRLLWSKTLTRAGLRSTLASDPNFWVAHLMIPARDRARADSLVEHIYRRITDAGLEVLIDQPGKVNAEALGANAKKNEPVFWQFAGMNGQVPHEKLEQTLFRVQTQLERDLGVHFPSFSSRSVTFKVQGTVEILRRYYPELRDPDFASTVTLGHARYSTNTNSIFERVQPFNVLGHNGEFNTISRFRLEAMMLGIQLDPGNSDSQDIDRGIDALCMDYGLDLIEAMEYIFPPYDHDLPDNEPHLHAIYDEIRQTFGPFAQGPAAVAARIGDQCVFSVDALGLRPLWFGETEKEYFASSERGVYAMEDMVTDPKPLAPGEKVALVINMGRPVEVLDYPAIQRHVYNRYRDRRGILFNGNGGNGHWGLSENGYDNRPQSGAPSNGGGLPRPVTQIQPVSVVVAEAQVEPKRSALPWEKQAVAVNTTTMAALGWERYHLSVIEALAETSKEQIGSLGWDGALAPLSQTRVNLADHFKETVAVVTNPSIDRERERAQFSTAVLLGTRPQMGKGGQPNDLLVQLKTPLIVGGHPDLGSLDDMRAAAEKHGTMTMEDIADIFGDRLAVLPMVAASDEHMEDSVTRLGAAAVELVKAGVQCILLDDTAALDGSQLWIDPLLATAAVDRALRRHPEQGINLRRRVGLIVRSGAMRDLHDVTMLLGMGANALIPYAIYAVALGIAPRAPKEPLSSEQIVTALSNTIKALTGGIEKVTSTIGCHELRGFGKSFSSVGLASGIAALFNTPNYFGSEGRGKTWTALKDNAEQRAAELRGESAGKLNNPDRIYPKMWKKVEDMALGETTLDEYSAEMLELEAKMPVAIRHILGLKPGKTPVAPEAVDISIGDYDMPILIGAMSYGSQGELAYKAYAEAAHRLNILCVNGEGGELPDIMGKYYKNRGQQIASARFGVNIEFLNSACVLEIKVGQGAKPGEGGHLPGYKVTEQVALARHTVPGVDLISPSNNHDIYSIEDLAQIIDELKTANPHARVSVKIPVVPGVGIIAVGVAKAGADIINITGFEGGTGAARAHSLRHVGLPAEIGVWQAHRQLIEAGLRGDVELWCDGGMKSGRDVLKMLCLGANRVGFGTMAMVAVGCTICRKCHEGTCHVGITTHIRTKDEAAQKGIKHFEPRVYEQSVQGIVNVFNNLAEDIRRQTAYMGFTRTQDVVGRADLLEQIGWHEEIDLSPLQHRVPFGTRRMSQPGVGRLLARPRNTLSKQITEIVHNTVLDGEFEMTYNDDQVMAMDRALGTHVAGALQRREIPDADQVTGVHLHFNNSAVPGNGLGAFLSAPVDILVEGGAQDGVGKCAKSGAITILKGLNHDGCRLDGSVGKSFAYGAQGGLFIVQGNADTRACIRLSGADVIFGGEVTEPLRDELGNLASRANLKGYACEYMTSGRVMVLGDPGPWLAAGMSGGAIYQRIQPEMGLTTDAIRRRIAAGSMVDIFPLDETGEEEVLELLRIYIHTIESNNQPEAVAHLYELLSSPRTHFVKIAAPNRKN